MLTPNSRLCLNWKQKWNQHVDFHENTTAAADKFERMSRSKYILCIRKLCGKEWAFSRQLGCVRIFIHIKELMYSCLVVCIAYITSIAWMNWKNAIGYLYWERTNSKAQNNWIIYVYPIWLSPYPRDKYMVCMYIERDSAYYYIIIDTRIIFQK